MYLQHKLRIPAVLYPTQNRPYCGSVDTARVWVGPVRRVQNICGSCLVGILVLLQPPGHEMFSNQLANIFLSARQRSIPGV